MLRRRPTLEQVVASAVMAVATLFVLRQLYPSLILRPSTPIEGDLAGHFYVAAQFRDHILPDFRLSGWSQGWFTGYPSLSFYFPLGFVLVAAVDLLVPFATAFKLVVALGPLALPVSAYAFGRLSGCDRLTSACLGVGVLPLLLQPTIFVAGGSISASTGGEFSYGLAQALGLLVVGLARSGLHTGKRRVWTAALLGATALLHIVQTVMVVVAIVVATATAAAARPAWSAVRAKLRWTASVLTAAGLLAGFWAVPFILRTQYTAGSEYPKSTPLLAFLFPVEMVAVAVLAGIGALLTAGRDPGEHPDLQSFLILMAAVAGTVFGMVPGGRVSNLRFLPVWYLWLCLLGGYGMARLARAAGEWRRLLGRRRLSVAVARCRVVAPAVLLVLFFVLLDSRDRRGLLTRSEHLGQTTTAPTRFAGYEGSAARAEFEDYIHTMRAVAREHGCGRMHQEMEPGGWSDYRLPLVFLVPYWTDGCLTTTWGYFTEASSTSPAVARVNGRLLSGGGMQPNAPRVDLSHGVDGLRSLGVRYVIATSPTTVQAADGHPDLKEVGRTASYEGRSWTVYEVSGAAVVEPLRHLPVVVPGIGGSRTGWDEAAGSWYEAGNAGEVVAAASGPANWPRHDSAVTNLPRRRAPEATVDDVRIGQDRLSFRVSRTGVPVLVKVSYFPNWRVAGAEGPWRATPNQMVVVPTSKTVTLRYGRTAVDHLGWLATLAGIGALAFLARRGPIDMRAPDDRHPTRDEHPLEAV